MASGFPEKAEIHFIIDTKTSKQPRGTSGARPMTEQQKEKIGIARQAEETKSRLASVKEKEAMTSLQKVKEYRNRTEMRRSIEESKIALRKEALENQRLRTEAYERRTDAMLDTEDTGSGWSAKAKAVTVAGFTTAGASKLVQMQSDRLNFQGANHRADTLDRRLTIAGTTARLGLVAAVNPYMALGAGMVVLFNTVREHEKLLRQYSYNNQVASYKAERLVRDTVGGSRE